MEALLDDLVVVEQLPLILSHIVDVVKLLVVEELEEVQLHEELRLSH